ncbi:hypothetical protein ACFE04_022152 [Oxalis oulophora]
MHMLDHQIHVSPWGREDADKTPIKSLMAAFTAYQGANNYKKTECEGRIFFTDFHYLLFNSSIDIKIKPTQLNPGCFNVPVSFNNSLLLAASSALPIDQPSRTY